MTRSRDAMHPTRRVGQHRPDSAAESVPRPGDPGAVALPPSGRRRPSWHITDGLLYHLSFTSELLTAHQEAMLAKERGISLTEWRILAVVSSFRRISSKDITRVSSMNKAAVSRGVARLEAEGLVERVVDAVDTRIHWLRLTRGGKSAFAGIRRSVESWTAPIVSALDADEMRVFKKCLARLRARLGDVTGEPRAMSDAFIFRDRD